MVTYSTWDTASCRRRNPRKLRDSFSSCSNQLETRDEKFSDRTDGMPAIILMAYGSPNSLDEVGDYLAQVRGGRGSSPDEIEHLKQRYQRVGGQTPLLQITKSQAVSLEKKLIAEGASARVFFGMKHWHPFVEDVIEKISIDNPPILVGLALAPHYSRLSIGGYEDSIRRGLDRKHSNVHLVMVKSWHTEPLLITALSTRVSSWLSEMSGSEG